MPVKQAPGGAADSLPEILLIKFNSIFFEPPFFKSDAPIGAYEIVHLIYLGLRAALRRSTPGYCSRGASGA
jgi:hypothetical protein